MKIKRVESPEGYTSGHWLPEDINVDAFADIGADRICYWYSSGYYEGQGQAVFHVPGLGWFSHDMGHCSCYGPTDDQNAPTAIPSHAKASLDELEKSFSAYGLESVRGIIDELRKE